MLPKVRLQDANQIGLELQETAELVARLTFDLA